MIGESARKRAYPGYGFSQVSGLAKRSVITGSCVFMDMLPWRFCGQKARAEGRASSAGLTRGEHASDGCGKLGDIHRLDYVAVESGGENLDLVVNPAIRGQRDDRNPPASGAALPLAPSPCEVKAVLAGHSDVGYHHVGTLLVLYRERGLRRGDRGDGRAERAEQQLERFAGVRIVVNDQDR